MKKALITGVTGQDGACLAELILEKGYEVHGIKRRRSLFNTDRIDHLYQYPHTTHRQFVLHHEYLTDSSNLIRIIQQVQPDEIYNLGAQNNVAVSFEGPEYTANSDALGTLRILEVIRILDLAKKHIFIRKMRRDATDCCGKYLSRKPPPFISTAPMRLQSSMPTGQR